MEMFETGAYTYVNLNRKQISALSDAILNLPHEGICLIFGKFCFGFDMTVMSKLYGFEHPSLDLYYYLDLLCYKLGLSDGEMLSMLSIKRAGQLSMRTYIDKEFYSGRSMKMSIARKLLIAAIISVLSFTTALAVSPQLRALVGNWVIEIWEDYGQFKLESEEVVTPPKLGMYIPSYVPEGFELVDTVQLHSLICYEYEKTESERFDITVTLPNQKIYLSAEDSEIITIQINGLDAIYFCKVFDDIGPWHYIVFEKEGYAIYVEGSISKEELIRIAKSI